ncbi:hypothetical protein H1235_00350 [Pseudoxanthomonas sp. NC8]|nr:hypothetical protein H1235_00350 [Pseudoxanthomonas sp. NC8]
MAAIVSACITLAATLIAMSGTDIVGFSAQQLVDVALICALAFGIYRKSRACAVIMFGYFVLSKIMQVMQAGAGVVPGARFRLLLLAGDRGNLRLPRARRPLTGQAHRRTLRVRLR